MVTDFSALLQRESPTFEFEDLSEADLIGGEEDEGDEPADDGLGEGEEDSASSEHKTRFGKGAKLTAVAAKQRPAPAQRLKRKASELVPASDAESERPAKRARQESGSAGSGSGAGRSASAASTPLLPAASHNGRQHAASIAAPKPSKFPAFGDRACLLLNQLSDQDRALLARALTTFPSVKTLQEVLGEATVQVTWLESLRGLERRRLDYAASLSADESSDADASSQGSNDNSNGSDGEGDDDGDDEGDSEEESQPEDETGGNFVTKAAVRAPPAAAARSLASQKGASSSGAIARSGGAKQVAIPSAAGVGAHRKPANQPLAAVPSSNRRC